MIEAEEQYHTPKAKFRASISRDFDQNCIYGAMPKFHPKPLVLLVQFAE